jgi:hypothetical protein
VEDGELLYRFECCVAGFVSEKPLVDDRRDRPSIM